MRNTGLAFLLSFLVNCTMNDNTQVGDDYLVRFIDKDNNTYGYKDQNGETIIFPGKYHMCFTDTFRTYAIVAEGGEKIIGIDRKGNYLYDVFILDNGPDYASNNCFRIIINDKIGYADAVTGSIIIPPSFKCAYPFKSGLAKVSTDCFIESDGEHSNWKSNKWIYIDRSGKTVNTTE